MASRALSIEQLTRTSFGKLGCNKSIHTCFQELNQISFVKWLKCTNIAFYQQIIFHELCILIMVYLNLKLTLHEAKGISSLTVLIRPASKTVVAFSSSPERHFVLVLVKCIFGSRNILPLYCSSFLSG